MRRQKGVRPVAKLFRRFLSIKEVFGILFTAFVILYAVDRYIVPLDLGNYASELFGIFLTVFFIDYALEQKEEKRRRNINRILLGDVAAIVKKTERNLHTFLGVDYSADLAELVRTQELDRIVDQEGFLDESIELFSFKNLVPREHLLTRREYLEQTVRETRSEINEIIAKYHVFIPAEVMEKLYDLSSTHNNQSIGLELKHNLHLTLNRELRRVIADIAALQLSREEAPSGRKAPARPH